MCLFMVIHTLKTEVAEKLVLFAYANKVEMKPMRSAVPM